MQELQDQLSSVEGERTTLPRIQQAAPGRVVSALAGGGEDRDSSKPKIEKVTSMRGGEEAFAKLREIEEQLITERQEKEQAAEEMREMSQDLQDLKEVCGAKGRGH